MKSDLNTLYAVITTIVIFSVLNTEPAECVTYNGAYLRHHSLHQPHGYLKGYGLPSANSLHHPYNFIPGGYQHPHAHAHPYHHHHHYHQVQQQSAFHDPHTHMHHEDNLLKESAKDPRNLKNGILQNGAVTYDLGMPRYEILNAHEAPEIITSDQPHYQEHLKQLQQSQNFTLEDFGATTAAPSTSKATTTTEKPTTEPTTTTSLPDEGPMMLSKESKYIQRNVDKELSKVKAKIQELNDHIKTKNNQNHAPNSLTADKDVNFFVIRRNENLRRKMKPSAFKAANQRDNSNQAQAQVQTQTQTQASNGQSELPAQSVAQAPAASSVIQERTNIIPQQPISHSNIQESKNGQDFFVSSPNTFMQSSLPQHHLYVQNPALNAVPPSFPPLPPQYSNFSPYQGLPSPLNSAAMNHMQMTASNMHRLYRSAAYLENVKKTDEKR